MSDEQFSDGPPRRDRGSLLSWHQLEWIGLILLGLAMIPAFRGCQPIGGGGSLSTWEGKAAPELEFTTINGNSYKLSSFRGRRVIIDLWATWCPPCRAEIPHFNRLAEEFPNQLVVIGISSEPVATLRKFTAENKVNYLLVSLEQMPPPLSLVTGIPTTFFLDEKGMIEQIFVGGHSYGELKAAAIR